MSSRFIGFGNSLKLDYWALCAAVCGVNFRSSFLIFYGVGLKIFIYHKSNLENYGVIEFAKVESGYTLNFFETVNEGVSMNEKLTGGLGNVKIVLEEFLNGKEGLLIETLYRAALENLSEEGLTEGSGELINKAGDTEVAVADDGLVGIEYLSDL